MTFRNRELKRASIRVTITIFLFFIFFYFIANVRLTTMIGFFIVPLFMLLFFPLKYELTDENTIEFYNLFGRKKRLSMPIENITEILVKPYSLSIDYKTREDVYPRSTMLELSETDMQIMIGELTKRNPKIIIS